MITTTLFAVLALAALAAAGLAVFSRRRSTPLAGLAVALAAMMLLYEGSGLAFVGLAAVGGAALVIGAVERGAGAGNDPTEGPREDEPAGAGRLQRLAAGAVLAGLALVLVGTWARQFVWAGRELVPGTGFGEMPALAAALAGAPGLLGIGLLLVVAVAACAGAPRHRI